jgi:Rieske 2Fe-2S family protein
MEWFVHEDAIEGADYEVDRLTEAWDKTNLEDVFLSENNYKGVRSLRFKPGPHVLNRESAVRTALMSYLNLLNAPDA